MAESGFTANELVVLSDLLSRSALSSAMGVSFNGKRSYWDTFGYPSNLTFDDYYFWYRRGGLAKRIIDLLCKTTWRYAPEILDDENPKSENPFEAAWTTLEKRLQVTARLCRADILQSIGQYAVMLLGTSDGAPLDQPIADGQFRSPDDLLYLQPLSESHATITQIDTDPRNPRYGLPLMYSVQLGASLSATIPRIAHAVPVHFTRILHFAEDTLEDDVLGIPRLEAIINLLTDLLKVTGGGAETYWLNAANKVKVETDPDFKFAAGDMAVLKDKVAEFVHNLSPWLILEGMKAERMGVQIADPSGNYSVLLDQIAGTVGIPRRILTGSELGELASSQDQENFAQGIMSRQMTFAEPQIQRQTVDRLIALGILPPPTNGEYTVKWEHPNEPSDLERAGLALQRAQAAQTYVQGSGEMVLTVGEFRESMGLEPEKPEDPQAEELQQDEEQNPQVQEQFQRGRQAA